MSASYHAEQQLLRKIAQTTPEVIRALGKGWVINIISIPGHGGSAKPCLKCLTLLKKKIPLARVISYRHGVLEQNSIVKDLKFV